MAEKRKNRVGIKDVAQVAGVSTTSVSDALSGKGRISTETRRHIVKVATELGYRPNATARNLVSGRTGLLGITVSASDEVPFGVGDFDYFIQLLSAATGAAVASGHALVVQGATANGATAFDQVEIDGAIVVDPVDDDPLLDSLDEMGIPIVTAGRRAGEEEKGTTRYWIDNDHHKATMAILNHLSESGANKIGLVSSPPIASYTRDAVESYEEWCNAHQQNPEIVFAEGPINEGSGFQAAGKLLDSPDPPDAIYATLDQLALGALLAARERSIDVPGDLLVAGCTDSEASAWATPPLTAVLLNPEEIGRAAVNTLICLIEGGSPETNPVLIPAGILPRESTSRIGQSAPPP
ncbi:MAG: LacI family DNA-binding transcriptional regulator [Thermoleophilia bacterium]|nr:LacI family DNA-binding transcriptional regulator [Thermoleophilia bacterium]